jgi:glycine/D-amino acid oxidase-like deaminating enzyme
MYKALIVGDGIAGLTLAWTLEQRGAEVVLMADPTAVRATTAAAGVINPVTGKRYVKSRRYEVFYAAAQTFYQALERRFEAEIWRERPIVRMLGSAAEANTWSQRAGTPEYSPFIQDLPDAGPWAPFVRPGHYFGQVAQSAQVDFAKLTAVLLPYFERRNALRAERLAHARAAELAARYDAVVCCEGAGVLSDPFFPGIPWMPAKGEGLLVEFQDEGLNTLLREHPGDPTMPMLKKNVLIAAPQHHWNRLCWVGATYSWDYPDALPSLEGAAELTQALKSMIEAPFVVRGHFSGIRQVTKDRNAVLGASPVFPKFYLFNGLGSKGGLLAPYWAAQLAAHLLEGAPLEPDADIRRFLSD